MFQTSQLSHGWSSHPNIDHSFRHSFSWPHPHPEVGQAGSAASAATEGAAAMASGGHIPPGGVRTHYHMYGRGSGPWMYRRRFGGFRRLFWFGLGVGAAMWYVGHKERKRQREEWIKSGVPPEKAAWGCDNSWGYGWRNVNNSYKAHPPQFPNPAVASPPYSSSVQEEPPKSAVLTALQEEPIAETQSQGAKRWGWGERRRKSQELREAHIKAEEDRKTSVHPSDSASTTGAEEEMRRLREIVESLWSDQRMTPAAVQAKANETNKELAREKLDRLSAALDKLRESLNSHVERRSEKKLV